ncbi:SSI family serine proteinase inhibitor [Streptomyces sp. NPDC050145]|uniref:SSI family serine proteinase inhibitor n=1 Tax=Streptomyces sp. NPDC050145 TaxID=3365602 RepID=UPI00378A01BA
MLLRRFSSRASASPTRTAARLLLTAAASAAALGASLPAAAHADTGPIRTAPGPVGLLDGLLPKSPAPAPSPDKLTLTVADSGNGNDGTYELRCAPAGGTHPDAAAACARLDEIGNEGQDPFAPAPKDQLCTMQYGGPATAHITGTWHGRAVDASYSLADGCQIARWQQLSPVLPATAQ